MLLGGTGLTLAGALFEHPDYARGTSLPSVLAVLYLAVLGSGIAFYLNHWLLQRLTAWQVGLSSLVVPVIAVAAGALLGGEAFGWKELAGATLVVVGVWLALRSGRTAQPPGV
jgi:drug/metabolite transporter (DMT)-like permease